MRRASSRRATSAEMSAKGAQSVTDQEMPTKAVMMVAAVGVEMKKVLNMQRAKKRWDMSHVRRRVKPGI